MTRAHFMSWAAQDWLSSTLRGDLAMERDHVTRLVYRELLDVLHERGGYVVRDEVAGACLVTRDEAESAVVRLLKSGRIEEKDGKLYNRRVLEGLAERAAFVARAAADGRVGGRRSVEARRTKAKPRVSEGSGKGASRVPQATLKPSVSVPSPSPLPLPPPEPETNTPQPPPGAMAVVFEHWREAMGHPQAKLDPKREKAIKAALKLGYPAEQLKRAIDGYRASPWHRGANDRKATYDALGLILRDAEHIDRGLALAEEHSGRAAPPEPMEAGWSRAERLARESAGRAG